MNKLRFYLLAFVLALAGCASGPHANPNDPLEPFNRGVMQFNEGIDAALLKPVATVYKEKVPPLVRTGVSNFFGNLSDVWSFVNNVLQFKLQAAGETWIRLNVNTLFGFGGILDIASEMNIERHRQDFGQTLGRWGVESGPFIMLPLLGPSTLRDTMALPVDAQFNPLSHVGSEGLRHGLTVLRVVDTRSNLLRVGSVLEEAALDRYSFVRDAYLQRRGSQIEESKEQAREALERGELGLPVPRSRTD